MRSARQTDLLKERMQHLDAQIYQVQITTQSPRTQSSQRYPLPDELGTISSNSLDSSSPPVTPISGDLLSSTGLCRYLQVHSMHSHRHINVHMNQIKIISLKVHFCIPRKLSNTQKRFTDFFSTLNFRYP